MNLRALLSLKNDKKENVVCYNIAWHFGLSNLYFKGSVVVGMFAKEFSFLCCGSYLKSICMYVCSERFKTATALIYPL